MYSFNQYFAPTIFAVFCTALKALKNQIKKASVEMLKCLLALLFSHFEHH
jgi:hypothetical protein